MYLTPGQVITSKSFNTSWEVVSISNETADTAVIRVLACNDKYMSRYLDEGNEYPLERHKHWGPDLLLWEIPGSAMKRSVSQVLLQWELGVGFTIDLDM